VQAKILLCTTSNNPYYFPGVIIQLYWCWISDYQRRSAIICCQWHSCSTYGYYIS